MFTLEECVILLYWNVVGTDIWYSSGLQFHLSFINVMLYIYMTVV
jgi:hypothetical protein